LQRQNMAFSRGSILFIGNFLSAHFMTKSVSEEMAIMFKERGWVVYTTSQLRNRILRLLDMVITIFRYKNHFQFSIIEVYSGWAFIWAFTCALLLKKLEKPFILTLHGGGLITFYKKYPYWVKSLLQLANLITTPSKFLQEFFLKFRSDIIYIPNGILLENYYFLSKKNPKPVIAWLRAFHETYNPKMAIDSIYLLANQLHDIHLQMIGPDKKDGSKEMVEELIAKYNLKSKIELVGPVDKKDVSNWLNKSDIFLNTTNFESFGVSVLEAAACGLCIVTTNVGELSYLWENEVDALLVPPNDPEAMAAAIQRILTEPGLAARLSANARKKAEQFVWSFILPQWEKIFIEVLQNNY